MNRIFPNSVSFSPLRIWMNCAAKLPNIIQIWIVLNPNISNLNFHILISENNLNPNFPEFELLNSIWIKGPMHTLNLELHRTSQNILQILGRERAPIMGQVWDPSLYFLIWRLSKSYSSWLEYNQKLYENFPLKIWLDIPNFKNTLTSNTRKLE